MEDQARDGGKTGVRAGGARPRLRDRLGGLALAGWATALSSLAAATPALADSLNAGEILTSFMSTFGGGLGFLGGLLAVIGIIMLVLNVNGNGGQGGAQISGAIFLIIAGVVVWIVSGVVTNLDTTWANAS